MSSFERRLADLYAMTPAQLRAEWRDCWRKPAPEIGPDLLRRGIAWKRQSRVHGDLPSQARREIEAVLSRLSAGKPAVDDERISLRPGTRLAREWRGTMHQVVVLERGYEHEGRNYSSLTQVASAITGAHWSGPRFFDLKGRKAPQKP
ncbi:DUF2924 domain-containing protein [Sphingomonas sp.]|uniref:DUF2924 domain-containing protein n=1 Tax=Sphingomonas sp. TaxID=28214 RepID=UPI0017D304EF|nr:DUF2924 domain-containing protein [Sphingomonas sp.]MBA3512289.1 DUF2924 domain-containing protein [Sphingomonas sp.]